MTWKTLLVPHDFSDCAAHALTLAVDLARVHGAGLGIVHVSDMPANIPPDALITPPGEKTSVRVDEYAMRGARQRLEEIARPLREGPDASLRVRTLAVTGDVPSAILDAARELGADAIVVGTHGRTGLSHLLLGSVAEKVVRLASIPVITVRYQSPEARLTTEERRVEDELDG